jgi:putative endonuclease
MSDDVHRRLHQHNSGVSQWTRSRGPWILAWTSEALLLSDARKLENLLKRQKAAKACFELPECPGILAHNPAKRDSLVQIQPLHPI